MTHEIAADRRRIEAEPDEQAHADVVALAPQFAGIRVAVARALVRVAATRTFVAHDCATIEEYGSRYLGVGPREARELVEIGHSLDLPAPPALAAVVAAAVAARAGESAGVTACEPPGPDSGEADPALGGEEPTAPTAAGGVATVADALVAGALCTDRAVAAGRLVATAGLLQDGEDPVALAMSGPMHAVRSQIRRREEERAQHEVVVPLALAVTERAREGFRRARSLASERAGEMLTEGQTFSVVVESYLERFDPLRRGEGERRVPDTRDLPGGRYVPAAVKRAVRLRADARCEIPGCPHRAFLEFAHVHAHASGGSREAGNLVLVCDRHHVLLDAGRVRVSGWEAGRPVFTDANGRRLDDVAPIGAGVAGGAVSADAADRVSEDAGDVAASWSGRAGPETRAVAVLAWGAPPGSRDAPAAIEDMPTSWGDRSSRSCFASRRVARAPGAECGTPVAPMHLADAAGDPSTVRGDDPTGRSFVPAERDDAPRDWPRADAPSRKAAGRLVCRAPP